MIMKRILIVFAIMMKVAFDKKRQLIAFTRGKSKVLKHICAYLIQILQNSYIIVGVEDQDNTPL
jgi:hypothetical protein